LVHLKFLYRSLFVLVFFIGCKKIKPTVFTPRVEEEPVQYGVPFTGVPSPSNTIMYEVNMRCFSDAGNFAGVISRLDSIQSLGVNVLYLMPIYSVGETNSVNSPYCVKDYAAVNPEFGTLTQLRTLIDSAHHKNMSVILDFVANHTSWDNAWISQHSDWYLQNNSGNIVSPPGMGWNDVAQLNFNSGDMRKALIKKMKFWVYTANVDGFRFDYADGPPVDFWKQAVDTLRAIQTHQLLLLAEGSRNSNFSAGFDFNFGFGNYGQLKNIFGNQAAASTLDALNNSEFVNANNQQQVVRYTSNHDVNGSDGIPQELFGGNDGAISAFVIAAFMKGVPMIYNGQEVGTPFRLTFPFTGANINWNINANIKALYKKLMDIRRNSTAIKTGALQSFSDDAVCSFVKAVPGENILVICNTRNANVTYTLPSALQQTNWQNQLDNNNVSLGVSINLNPYEFYILKQL